MNLPEVGLIFGLTLICLMGVALFLLPIALVVDWLRKNIVDRDDGSDS